jgi:peptidyl-prolyl cis-trans isomerase D
MGWIALAILGLIGVTFIFVGGANFAFVGSNYAAKVDGKDIALGQFEAAYRDQLQENPQLATLPDNLRLQLRSNILEQLIRQRVIDNYISDAGYQMPDQFITDMIQRAPEFQVDGKFNLEQYRTVLLQAGYEPTEFERAQRTSMRRDQLQRAIRGSAIMSPAEYRRYLNLAAEQRLVRMATISQSATAETIEVTDEEIAAWYEANADRYELPETADVEYVEIQRSDVAASVSVSESDLAEYYEFNKDRYQQDEQRQARHILVLFNDDEEAAEAKANELLARINAGESFEDVARENSDDGGTAEQGGDLGVLTRTQLPGELGGAIFSMEEGAVAGPVETEFGFHIVRLDEIFERGPLPLDQVRGELMTELQGQQAENLFLDLERQMSDALFDASDIRALAETVGFEVQTAAGFTRNGGEPLGNDPAVINAVFSDEVLTGGRMSDIVEIGGDRAAVFAVTAYNPATRQPLEDVRDRVIAELKAQRAEDLMAAKADEFVAAVRAGTDFAEAAEAVGAIGGEEPVLMSRNADDLDQLIGVAVFTAVKPTQEKPTVGSARNNAGGFTVYSIEAVIPGRPEVIPLEQRDAGKLQLADESGIGDFSAFIQALRDNAEVIINEDALAAQDLL